MSIRITCINKAGGNHEDPHVAISILGWIEDGTGKTGRNSRLEIYNWVKEGGRAYVQDSLGVVYLVARFLAPKILMCKPKRTADRQTIC
ncbi:MAG: hypothetical protein QOE77_3307 [Blastocatellia bacterium]|jgi:hypothetical protein|nr:hypothetical protein [Blastocatellia bacterium]